MFTLLNPIQPNKTITIKLSILDRQFGLKSLKSNYVSYAIYVTEIEKYLIQKLTEIEKLVY